MFAGQSYSVLELSTHASKKACPLCDLANHSASKCLKVANPNIRKEISREKRLCFIYLESDMQLNFARQVINVKSETVSTSFRYVLLKRRKNHKTIIPLKVLQQILIMRKTVRTLLQPAIAMVSNLSDTNQIILLFSLTPVVKEALF